MMPPFYYLSDDLPAAEARQQMRRRTRAFEELTTVHRIDRLHVVMGKR